MKAKKVTVLLLTVLILSACSFGPLSDVNLGAPSFINQSADAAAAPTASAPPAAAVSGGSSPEAIAALQGTLEDIYSTVSPSVVNIEVTGQASVVEEMPFAFPGMPQDQQQAPVQHALGSGFVWDSQGHIVTNNHVVENANSITVRFAGGQTAEAKLVGADPDADLAVIQVDVDSSLLKPVTLTDSAQVKVGQMAIAIGNPYGLEGTMTVGIISALSRSLPVGDELTAGSTYTIPDIIQTDAPINPGNSGGVLLNDLGQVVGVTSAIESSSGANAGIGFVIPANIVSRIVPVLIETGRFEHPWLGISGTTLTPEFARANDLDQDQRGILVVEVTSGSPADEAGMVGSRLNNNSNEAVTPTGGDVITAIDGTPMNDFDDLASYLVNSAEVGQNIKLEILRDGKTMTLDVHLTARPDHTNQLVQEQPQQTSDRAYLGIVGLTLNPSVAEAMDLDADQQGVLIVQVAAGSPADDAGLAAGEQAFTIQGQQIRIGGDVITAIDDQPVSSMEDLRSLLNGARPGDEVDLTVLRDGRAETVALTLGSN